MTTADKKGERDLSRRQFFRRLAQGAGGIACMALLFTVPQRRGNAQHVIALRPPGALPEEMFNQACIRCGQCVQACPYDCLTLANHSSPVAVGTPYFIAREIPCEMCDDLPCVRACPSGALDPKLTDIEQAKMGLAVLLDQESCISWQGLRCDVCHRVCPLMNKAITIERQRNERTGSHAKLIPTVHSDYCTGCGKCEQACVLDKPAIKVLPLSIAKGELGHHYRLGWKEKEKAGHSLVPETETPPIRRPEELP